NPAERIASSSACSAGLSLLNILHFRFRLEDGPGCCLLRRPGFRCGSGRRGWCRNRFQMILPPQGIDEVQFLRSETCRVLLLKVLLPCGPYLGLLFAKALRIDLLSG